MDNRLKVISFVIFMIMTLSACSIIPNKKDPQTLQNAIYPSFVFQRELVECTPDEVSFMESIKSTVDSTEFFDFIHRFKYHTI